MSSFGQELMHEVLGDLRNHFEDNYDIYRYEKSKLSLKQHLRRQFRSFGSRHWLAVTEVYDLENRLSAIEPYLDEFSTFYDRLEDAGSKELFVKLIAFRILGEEKVRLPLGETYWEDTERLAKLTEGAPHLDTGLPQLFAKSLPLFKLDRFNFPISLYYSIPGIYSTFVARQYEHPLSGIAAKNGDYVLDIGACWGDTALYFADRVGDSGKVFAFEFIPGNLSILRKNLGLNEELVDRVVVVEKPVWECSGMTLNYTDAGPGSMVSFENGNGMTGKATTISIDDFVVSEGIERIDFIKMDIEGAEMAALRGAEQTIRRFKPRLAIAAYHKLSDFRELSGFIHDLGMDYKFHLGHYTIHHEETILFAH